MCWPGHRLECPNFRIALRPQHYCEGLLYDVSYPASSKGSPSKRVASQPAQYGDRKISAQSPAANHSDSITRVNLPHHQPLCDFNILQGSFYLRPETSRTRLTRTTLTFAHLPSDSRQHNTRARRASRYSVHATRSPTESSITPTRTEYSQRLVSSDTDYYREPSSRFSLTRHYSEQHRASAAAKIIPLHLRLLRSAASAKRRIPATISLSCAFEPCRPQQTPKTRSIC